MSISPPAPSGNAATDFSNLRSFFSSAPAGAVIDMPAGATYQVWAGAVVLKPGQVIRGNRCIVQRAAEIKTTTAAAVTHAPGAMVVPVSSTAGFQIGQYIVLNGPRTGTGAALILWGDAYITAIGSNSLTLQVSQSPIDLSNQSYAPGAAWQAGTVVMTKGTLVDAARMMNASAMWTIERLSVDGNRGANTTLNHWEYAVEIKQFGRSCELNGIEIHDACGEGIILWGDNPRVDGLRALNLNGNAIHFNSGCNDAWCNNIHVQACNLEFATMGHASGAIIASNGTFRTLLSQFRIKDSRMGGVASFDSPDNAFAKVAYGYIEGCWQDGLGFYSSQALEGLEVSHVEVRNCGISRFGSNKTSTGAAGLFARKLRTRNLTFYDSLVVFSGLDESDIECDVAHTNSGVNTPSTVAAGRTSNYLTSTGSNYPALVTVFSCRRSTFRIRASDGGAPAGKYAVLGTSAAGGPMAGNRFDIKTLGGEHGVLLSGVLVRNHGHLEAEGWKSGFTGIEVSPAAHAVDTAFPAGDEKPAGNDFTVDAFLKQSNASGTVCVKTNTPTAADSYGWLTVHGRVHVGSITSGSAIGFAAQNTPAKLRWDDVEAIGPSGFVPLSMAAGDADASPRLRNVRCFPGPVVPGTRWVTEDGPIQVLPG